MSAVYTHGQHESVTGSYRWRTAANSAAYLLAHLRPGLRLLDVGCGPGTITVDLAAAVAPGLTTGVDASPEALDKARAATAARGLSTVDFTVADVHELAFDDDTFDVVHAHQVLQHVGDPVRALAEMRRVCRPGGVVAVRDADYEAMTWWPRTPAWESWLRLYRDVARRNGGEPDAGRRLLGWARAAGFTDITSTATAWCYATPEDRAWWGGQWSERVLKSSFATHAVSHGLASPADLEALSAGFLAWTDEPDGWFGILHGELICRP
jgi:SAM-dependent methyltransferase